MAQITRRDLLRGRPRSEDKTPLPRVISWLSKYQQGDSADGYRPSPQSGPALLRPPGAIAERDFLARCTKCDACAEACPHGAIRPAPERLREAAGTPHIEPRSAPCRLCEDFPCITACPTGALQGEPDPMGTARIATWDCLVSMGTECCTCVEQCPTGAIVAARGTPHVEATLCTGCGICEHACPAPNNAITILPNRQRPADARGGTE